MTTLLNLWQRGCDFLGVEHAILGGAMTWVSERNLVSSISNNGGFGVLACGAMSPELLKDEVESTKKLTSKPFGVNLILMHPGIVDLVQVCHETETKFVVLAGGIPTQAIVSQLKEKNTKVMAFAPNLLFAKKLVRMGVDALIIEGAEAGGHVGPVSTSVLAQEILPHIKEVPVFIAGGIGRGEMIVEYLRMGAAGVQLGTRFVCAEECIAHSAFKQAFIRAQARDATSSVQLDPRFPVIPVRALANKASQAFTQKQKEIIERFEKGDIELKEGQLEIEHFWAGCLRRAVVEGDVENGSLMAGQSVGMVTQLQSTHDIIQELIQQAEAYLTMRAIA